VAERYARQEQLEGFGPAGQRRLAGARVLLVGVGGLGCASAPYLVAGGVGTLRIYDGDSISETDLARQVLYRPDDVGRAKVDVAAERLRQLNPEVRSEPHASHVASSNIAKAIEGVDLIVDGTDNLAARHLLNRAYTTAGVPVVFGGATEFSGYVLICSQGGPCFACAWTEPPAATCGEVGVLGPLVGMVGAAQAAAAIGLLTGISTVSPGALTLFDARRMTARTVHIRRRPDCPVCGEPRLRRKRNS
jgi:molybdopterin/thiamine biosynthesis adenylyltransferase